MCISTGDITCLKKRIEPYRYGFNGQEKDDENFEGAYNFAGRINDSRLGRWLSVDPFHKLQANWSTYKSCKDNPIIFNDPSGGTEFVTTVFQDTFGNKMVLRVEKSEDVMTDGETHVEKITMFGEPWGESHHINYYHFETRYVYTLNLDGTFTEAVDTFILYDLGVQDEDLKTKSGNVKWGDSKDPDGINKQSSLTSGFHLVTSGEGFGAGVNAREGSESRNIDDLLLALSTFGKDPTEILKLKDALGAAGALETVRSIVEEVQDYMSRSESQMGSSSREYRSESDSLHITYYSKGTNSNGNGNISTGHSFMGVSDDTTGGVVQGDPNKVITDVQKAK